MTVRGKDVMPLPPDVRDAVSRLAEGYRYARGMIQSTQVYSCPAYRVPEWVGEAKDAYMESIRRLGKHTHGFAGVFVSPAAALGQWADAVDVAISKTVPDLWDRYDQAERNYQGNLQDLAERVRQETAAGRQVSAEEIADAKRTLLELRDEDQANILAEYKAAMTALDAVAGEVAGLKRALGLDPEQSFILPEDVVSHARKQAADNARAARADWDARFATWQQANPAGAALLERLEAHRLPEGLEEALPTWEVGESLATRAASGKVLSALAGVVPELWGGSADLAGSNNTTMAGEPSFLPAALAQSEGDGPFGRTLHFGVREHAMGSILNGIALDGLTRPYGGTFMVFSDYMRPAVRLAALMGIGPVFVWSHDSIGVGEDGPTHQPVEHLAALRAIPGLSVVRPGDANETAAAWAEILRRHDEPAGIALSRQNLTVSASATAAAEGVRRGAYVLAEATDARDNHPLARAGLRHLQALVHGHACTEDGGNLKQVSTFWNVCAVAGIYQHVFTEGTINRVAAVLGVVAQCFPTGAAMLTDTTGGP